MEKTKVKAKRKTKSEVERKGRSQLWLDALVDVAQSGLRSGTLRDIRERVSCSMRVNAPWSSSVRSKAAEGSSSPAAKPATGRTSARREAEGSIK